MDLFENFGSKILNFLRFLAAPGVLERSGRLIGKHPPILVPISRRGAELCPKNENNSRLLSSRVLKFERKNMQVIQTNMKIYSVFYVWNLILVKLILVNSFGFLDITRRHGDL